jgi:hypothetical protein
MPLPKMQTPPASELGASQNQPEPSKSSNPKTSANPPPDQAIEHAGEFAGMSLDEFIDPPTHPDAQRIWPILIFAFAELLDAGRELLPRFPRQANLCGRMASAIREQMIDAELGLLRASPEQRVTHQKKGR